VDTQTTAQLSTSDQELVRTASGQRVHVRRCPHVARAAVVAVTEAERGSLVICNWCRAELDGQGRTYHASIADALADLAAPQSSRARLTALLADVDHETIHVPNSRAYLALVKNGKATAWAGKTYVAYADGRLVPLADYATPGATGADEDAAWGETCPDCFTARSLSGSCNCF
jgi:hypothetical protein